MAKQPDPRPVQCYHCRHRFEVGAMAQSASCPACSKHLVIEDVVVKTLKSVRKMQTCGKVMVLKRGRVIATLVEAIGGVEVDGVMEANVVSEGPVRIGPTAQWKGDCRAPSLSAGLGCVIGGGFFEIHNGKAEPPAPQPALAGGAE